jgi:hypothetical protein
MIKALDRPAGAAKTGRMAPRRRKGLSRRAKAGWSCERRARHAALIRRSEPWRRSSGPRTEAGKARSSANALKHGYRSRAHIEMKRQAAEMTRQARHILRVSARNLAIVRAWLRARAAGLAPETIAGLEDVPRLQSGQRIAGRPDRIPQHSAPSNPLIRCATAAPPKLGGFGQSRFGVRSRSRLLAPTEPAVSTRSIICVLLVASVVPVFAIAAQAPVPQPGVPDPKGLTTNSLGTVDTERSITLSGQVKFVQLGPVRTRVQVLVTVQGQVQEWSLEGPTRQIFMTVGGQRRRPIAQWDNVTLSIHPLIERAEFGEIRALTAANGVAQIAP